MDKLSNREREALRLLARGHEAKSIASALGVSVHSVNERLRTARRKLAVSSSREAARLLLAQEARSAERENLGYKKIEVAAPSTGHAYPSPAHSGATGAARRLTTVTIGAVMLTVLVTVLMATQASQGPRNPEPIASLPSLFAVSDYPAEALSQKAQGITDFRLRVNVAGRVETCDIERSSGSAALDQATCRVIVQRSRFRPAMNGGGNAVEGTYSGMIHWRL